MYVSHIRIWLWYIQKTITHPLIFQEDQEKNKDEYASHSHIFTDGSKQKKAIGCAAK